MIKYVVVDVDGTLTDGKVYMGNYGEVQKAFSVKDGYAVNYILKPAGITPIVITARTGDIVINRCTEIGIRDVYQGILNKLEKVNELMDSGSLSECSYFGDDILDLECMERIKECGGVVGCPADAVARVRAIADYVCMAKAGEGAFREFSEWLTEPKFCEYDIKTGVIDALNYLKTIDIGKYTSNRIIRVNDNFFFKIAEYYTKNLDECEFESHRKHIDIQIILEGTEIIEIADISRLKSRFDYNEISDVIHWEKPEFAAETVLFPGSHIILYPENAHRGAVKVNDNVFVRKIIGKVRVC